MIFITGANGLIGSFITRKLISENKRVKILTRKNADLSLLEGITDQIELVEGDLLDVAVLEDALIGADAVIHCAAIVSFASSGAEEMFTVNVEGTKNIVNAALQSKIGKFIYLSSIASLGRDPKITEISENTQWIESDLNSEYAKSKYFAELEVWRGIEEGLNAAMLNPSVVLGPGDWNKTSTKIFKNIYEGMLFYPTGSINIVDVRDVAEAAWLLLNSNISHERYIINGHSLTYEAFLSKIATAFGKKEPSIKMPKNMALFFYYILRIFAPFYLSKRFINRETITISSKHFKYSNQKFIKAFNFSYRNPDETIEWASQGLARRFLKHKNAN